MQPGTGLTMARLSDSDIMRRSHLAIDADVELTFGQVHDDVQLVSRLRLVSCGPLPGLPELVAHMAAGFQSYESVFDMADTAAAFQVRLTPVLEFLQRLQRPVSA